MGSDEQYCLRWNDFETNIKNALYELKEEKDFADVTLVCKDGKVEAHKVILSARSTFFQKILKENPHSKPLIYLRGVKYSELNSVLRFVYCGEASIATANLDSFLALAEELEVKGLRDEDRDNNFGGQIFHPPAAPSAPTQPLAQSSHQPPPPCSDMFNNNGEKLMKAEPQSEPQEGTAEAEDELHQKPGAGDVNQYDGHDQYEDYDQDQDYVQGYNLNQEDSELESQAKPRKSRGRPRLVTDMDQHMEHVSGTGRKGEFKCKLCGKISTSKPASYRHIENNHFLGHNEYNCDRCNKKFGSYTKLHLHRRKQCSPTSGSENK